MERNRNELGRFGVQSPHFPEGTGRQDGETIRQYYIAVDRQQFKMETLVDLLDVTSRRSSIPIIICCSSRDELDSVCATISVLSYVSLISLYSDLAESQRSSTIEKFRQAITEWKLKSEAPPEDPSVSENESQMSTMLVVTDACLPLVAAGESPIPSPLLINYELPQKKETYTRRLSTCLTSSGGTVINMVVGGEVVVLKGIEESCGIVVEDMPINISEILLGKQSEALLSRS